MGFMFCGTFILLFELHDLLQDILKEICDAIRRDGQ